MSCRSLPVVLAVAWCASWLVVPARAQDVDETLDRAQALYDEFDLEGMRAALELARQGIDRLPAEERGGPSLRRLWLMAQAAIVEGEAAEANRYLVEIIALAPWWSAPPGYLTPELDAALERRRAEVMERSGTLDLGAWSGAAAVVVDGIDAPTGGTLAVLPGRHHVVVDPGDGDPVARWLDVTRGEVVAVPGPDDGEGTASSDGGSPGSAVGDGEPSVAEEVTTDAPSGAGPGPDGGTDPDAGSEVVSASSSPAAGLFRISIGGGGRVVTAADVAIAGGGGPAVAIGGGAVLGGHLALLGVLGLDVHGPAPLPADADQPGLEGSQRGVTLRLGVLAGPRITAGRDAVLALGGGGGVAVCGLSTTVGDTAESSSTGVGAYLAGSLSLERRIAAGVAVGPTVSYVHGFVGQGGHVDTALMQVTYQAAAVRIIEVGLLVSATGGR